MGAGKWAIFSFSPQKKSYSHSQAYSSPKPLAHSLLILWSRELYKVVSQPLARIHCVKIMLVSGQICFNQTTEKRVKTSLQTLFKVFLIESLLAKITTNATKKMPKPTNQMIGSVNWIPFNTKARIFVQLSLIKSEALFIWPWWSFFVSFYQIVYFAGFENVKTFRRWAEFGCLTCK